jgi:hypothetical protein
MSEFRDEVKHRKRQIGAPSLRAHTHSIRVTVGYTSLAISEDVNFSSEIEGVEGVP